MNRFLVIPLLAAVVFLASCEEKKKTSAVPPARAQAPTISKSAPPSNSPKIEEKAAPKPDAVEALIRAAEKEYAAGQANYSAGHMEAAKASFDRAFNVLLMGPADIRSDDRLQQEFDKLVERVNSLEMVALKEGDGFTEQQAEPAPIDEANEVTFPVDPNVKAKAAEELKKTVSDLPLVLNDAVASYINYFSSRARSTLEHGYVRSGRYREMILRTLKEEGVPQDLIFLAQAESGFHPLALSRAGARGMWQFMASRASGYGLERNWWIDERQDPERATRAAARHLKDLYEQFGDWYLAMAAYNSGPGNVQRAVQRTGYADFWELYKRGVLPGETRNYVPIILAITIMSKNPGQYGLDHLTTDRSPEADRVKINYPVDLRLVAECVDASVATLQELNPSLLRMTTPKDREFELRLPAGTGDKFQAAIAAIPADMRVWWRYHKVTNGDTLSSVARKYHTSAETIANANNLDQDDSLAGHAKLVIPITPGRRSDGETVAFSKHATRYKVRKGDTVLSVADDFSVPAESLRKWNRLRGTTLRAGRILLIYKPVAGASPEAQAVSYSRAKRGKRARIVRVSASSAGASKAGAHGEGREGNTRAVRKSRSRQQSREASAAKLSRSKPARASTKAIHKGRKKAAG